MHHKKRFEQSHIKIPVLIGVSGIEPLCGVTHMSIAIASYACHVQGRRTAYVELNGSHHIRNLLQEKELPFDSFHYGGISFYPEASSQTVDRMLSKGYETIVFDFGNKKREVSKDILLCNHRFMLAHGARWRQSKLMDWIESQEKTKLKQYQYLIPFASQRQIKELSYDYSLPFYAIPIQSDPFRPSLAMIQLLTKLLQ